MIHHLRSEAALPRRALTVCPHCDVVHQIKPVRRGTPVQCRRCGCELYRETELPLQALLAWTVAAALCFAIANLTPLLSFELAGETRLAPLWAGVLATWQAGQPLVALIAAMTTLIFPPLTLCLLAWVLVPMLRGERAPGAARVLHTLAWIRPWSMLEVFFLGVLVSLVKLVDVATVVMGPGLFAAVLLVLLMVRLGSFDLRLMWDRVPPSAADGPPR